MDYPVAFNESRFRTLEHSKRCDFSEALWGVKRGIKAHRLAWKPDKFIILQPQEKDTVSHLRMVFLDGKQVPWTPTRCDLIEEDWTEFKTN